jgi:hypothetical protein
MAACRCGFFSEQIHSCQAGFFHPAEWFPQDGFSL